ncbi:hypothetical protein V6N13_053673 [Hibiscus sabdariffa]
MNHAWPYCMTAIHMVFTVTFLYAKRLSSCMQLMKAEEVRMKEKRRTVEIFRLEIVYIPFDNEAERRRGTGSVSRYFVVQDFNELLVCGTKSETSRNHFCSLTPTRS